MPNQPKMLEGYRILDFTHFVAGPTCTRLLAEMGADVIKVERAPGGDRVRTAGIVRDGMSTYYFQHNHSKKSLGIDLKKPAARDLLLRMIPKVDVVVENLAPGVIAALGFGYDTLSKINPRLVMCSVSVAGQTGPLRTKPGYDYLGAALSAVTDQIGEADRPPSVPGMAIGDVSTGVAAAMAVGFALLHRERTGEGQYLDASILDTYFHMHELQVPLVSLRPARPIATRTGSLHGTGSPCGVFKARDGYIFMVVNPHEMARLSKAMGVDLLADPRFADQRNRVKNKLALRDLIENWLATFPDRDAAMAVLDRERVPAAPVLRLDESMAHPHLRGRRTVRRVKDAALGEFDIPGMPVKFSAWPERTDLSASRLGEDNERVLREVLGLADSEIAGLYADSVLIRGEPSRAQAAS